MFATDLGSHDTASVSLSISEPRINPKQQKALPQGAKRVTFHSDLFCSFYTPDMGSSSEQKTHCEGADAALSVVPSYADKGLQTTVCANICQSASQNLRDTHAACTEIEIEHAGYREGLPWAFKTVQLHCVAWSHLIQAIEREG